METSPFSILNGETTVLNGEFLRTCLISNLFFCGTLNGLHLFPKNETICIQNGDVPFLEGYLFILVVGLPRGIRDISIIFSSIEWIHHTFTCRNLICVLLIFLFATGIWIGVFSCVGFIIWKFSCNECKANQSQNWDCPSFFLILRCPFIGKRRMNNNT